MDDDAVEWPRFAAEVLSLYEPPLRRKATQRKMAQVLDQFGAICAMPADLSPATIARWRLDHAHYRPATVRTLLSALRTIAKYGASRGYLANPFTFRPLAEWLIDLEEVDPLPRHHAIADIGKVLVRADSEALGGPWEARRRRVLVYLLAFTGGRAAEILGLHAGDIDLAAGLVRIRPNGRRKLKTRRSRREVPIAAPLRAALEAWLAREDRPSEWVLPHGRLDGPWLHGTEASRALGHVAELGRRAGVAGLTLLSFRHSFATAAEAWGLGELAVMRLLGHARPQTQLGYRHPDPEQLRPAVDAVRF